MSQQFLLSFAYDGSAFHGLQPQPGLRTVGGVLLTRLRAVTGQEPYAVSFAARTDAGVHARVNFASCRLSTPMGAAALQAMVSQPHADGLSNVAIASVPFRIMARASACTKIYNYAFEDGCPSDCQDTPGHWQLTPRLNLERIHAALPALLGRHDFNAFRAKGCSAKTTERTMTNIGFTGSDSPHAGRRRYILHIEGDGFLRHMVRIIAGTLAEIGCALRRPESVARALEGGQRTAAGLTAPARGLTLAHITMEERLAPYVTALSLASPPF